MSSTNEKSEKRYRDAFTFYTVFNKNKEGEMKSKEKFIDEHKPQSFTLTGLVYSDFLGCLGSTLSPQGRGCVCSLSALNK